MRNIILLIALIVIPSTASAVEFYCGVPTVGSPEVIASSNSATVTQYMECYRGTDGKGGLIGDSNDYNACVRLLNREASSKGVLDSPYLPLLQATATAGTTDRWTATPAQVFVLRKLTNQQCLAHVNGCLGTRAFRKVLIDSCMANLRNHMSLR